MKLHPLALATIGLAGSIMLQAQPPGPPPDFTELKAYLNLTDSQVTTLHDLNRAQRESARGVSEELRSKHQTMNSAMRSGSTDAATLNATAQAIQAGEQKMKSIHEQYQAQAVAVLTPDQQAKLKTLAAAAALAPNIHQAAMLGLITPPGGGPGAGPGTGPGGGPGMFRRGGGGPHPPPQD